MSPVSCWLWFVAFVVLSDEGGAQFFYPSGVAVSADGTSALVADTDNHTIRRLNLIAVTPRAYLPIVGRS